MINKFATVYAGHIDFPDHGQNATPANERRFNNDQLAGVYDKLDPAHVATSQLHMGTTCMVEYMAVTMQSRFCRFAPSPKWRNLGVFGMLDETRPDVVWAFVENNRHL